MISIETRTQLAIALTLTASASISGAASAASMNDDLAEAAPLMPSLGVTLTPTDSTPLYSLPWQLRSVTIGNAARIDSTAAAFNDANGNLDVALATGLSVSYPIVRTVDCSKSIRTREYDSRIRVASRWTKTSRIANDTDSAK